MSAEVEAIAYAWISAMTAPDLQDSMLRIADARVRMHEAVGEFVGVENLDDDLVKHLVRTSASTKLEVVRLLADDREAVVYWHAEGVFSPLEQSAAPIPFDFCGTTWLRIEFGRVQEVWAHWDAASLLSTLGLHPNYAAR